MKEHTKSMDATLDATLPSLGEAMRMTTPLNLVERKPYRRRKLLAILILMVVFAGLWALTTSGQRAIDGPDQRQDLTDSGGEDAWLSSFTR